LAGLALVVAGSWANSANAACDGYDIVLLGGQSNAVGRGLTGPRAFTAAQIAAEPRVFQVARSYDSVNDPIWTYLNSQTFQITQASEPLMNNSNHNSEVGRIGFAYSFALLLASQEKDPNRCVLLVPAARDGTSILAWNLIDRQYAGDLAFFYLDMISRTKLALALLANSKVAAFLWLQGEEDSLTIASIGTPTPLRLATLMPDAATYKTQLQMVMAQLRTDTGCVPAMLGNLSTSFISNFSTDPAIQTNAETVKGQIAAAMKTVAAGDTCHKMAVIDSTGLLTNAQQVVTTGSQDLTHYSATAQINLSNRFYKEYKILAKP
jgi:hypothetical protein